MGISSDAMICYGVMLMEDEQFPWDDKKWEGELEEWWAYEVCGYKNPFELYDENGEYLTAEAPSESKIDEYYLSKFNFMKQNKSPVVLVTHCSYDYPMYILAMPGTVSTAIRGYPVELDPLKLFESDDEAEKKLVDFYEKYCKGQMESEEPSWLLFSLMG